MSGAYDQEGGYGGAGYGHGGRGGGGFGGRGLQYSLYFSSFSFSSIVKCLNFIFIATGGDRGGRGGGSGRDGDWRCRTPRFEILPCLSNFTFLIFWKNIVFSVIGTGDILYT